MCTFSLTAGKDNLKLFSEFAGTYVNVEPEHVIEEAVVSQQIMDIAICGQMDITSVDVKANGTNEFLFLFAGCGFIGNMRSVGLGLFPCLGGVSDTRLAFSTNVPPVGEDALDHVHHLCFEEKPMDQTEMIAEPVPPDIHGFTTELPQSLWLEITKIIKFL
jgi:hypothetical protein